jgi:hypothetical protein
MCSCKSFGFWLLLNCIRSPWNVLISLTPGEWGQPAWYPGGSGGLYKLVTCHQQVSWHRASTSYLLVTSTRRKISPHVYSAFQIPCCLFRSSFVVSLLASIGWQLSPCHCEPLMLITGPAGLPDTMWQQSLPFPGARSWSRGTALVFEGLAFEFSFL